MNTPSTSPWYVIHTKPRQEKEAAAQLLNQAYDVYLPMFTHWRKMKGAWAHTEEALFPRYLFARPTSPSQSIGPMRSTRGVSTIVRFTHEPALIPVATVEAIRAEADRLAAQHQEAVSPFGAGDSVNVITGPLAGLQGIVSRNAQERVIVLIELLGKTQRLAFPRDALSSAAA
jgi:transcriptional antiterminator RfaH